MLAGRYVPLGVFRIFNDQSLDRTLEGFFQLSVNIPESDLLVCLNMLILGPRKIVIVIFQLLLYFEQRTDIRDELS